MDTWKTVRVRGVGFAPRRSIQPARSLSEVLELEPRHLRDPFLRDVQKRWDRKYFDQTYTRESNGTCFVDAKVDHIGDHIAKLLKKVKRLADIPDNKQAFAAIKHGGVADAAIYRTQLANTLSFNLQRRLGSISTDATDLQAAKDLLIDALPQHYTEPHEHRHTRSAELRSNVRNVAIPALHMAHLILANYCDVEPKGAHLDRLADKPHISGIQ